MRRRQRIGTAAVAMGLAGWLGCGGAVAQLPAGGGVAPAPGQNQQAGSPAPSGPAAVGEILWYPAPSRCTYFTPENRAAFSFDDPGTWRFAFLSMMEKRTDTESNIERGYILVSGVLRELEKVRSGPDQRGNSVTVWRSAGEPRLNVTLTLGQVGAEDEHANYEGLLAVTSGDGKVEIEIVGDCGA